MDEKLKYFLSTLAMKKHRMKLTSYYFAKHWKTDIEIHTLYFVSNLEYAPFRSHLYKKREINQTETEQEN